MLDSIPRRDAALAAGVVSLGQLEVWLNGAIEPRAAAAGCELVLGAALAWRRKSPLATVVVVSLAASVEAIAHVPLQEPLVPLLAVARGERERSRRPQPRLRDLEQLVAGTREAGLPVEVLIEGRRRDLPPPGELSAYRIVQEGLTNALKHAAATQARVLLRFGEDELEVHIEDNGAGSGNGDGSRRGLAGIGERVALFGGRFDAGAASGGGWRLQATLPLPR